MHLYQTTRNQDLKDSFFKYVFNYTKISVLRFILAPWSPSNPQAIRTFRDLNSMTYFRKLKLLSCTYNCGLLDSNLDCNDCVCVCVYEGPPKYQLQIKKCLRSLSRSALSSQMFTFLYQKVHICPKFFNQAASFIRRVNFSLLKARSCILLENVCVCVCVCGHLFIFSTFRGYLN